MKNKNNQSYKEEPSQIFSLIKQERFDIIREMVSNNEIDVNVVDVVGNDVVTRLLKAKQYDLVLDLMKKRNWDVNHQNDDGNTFGHILAQDDSISTILIVEQLTKKKNYLPNIKNKKGETALDRAINSNYLCCVFKLLEDKRFNSISIISFKNLFNMTIKNSMYGKYSKITNLENIVGSLERKELDKNMSELIRRIAENMEYIKNDIINHNRVDFIEGIINQAFGF
jgi:ankyrin repeat protein